MQPGWRGAEWSDAVPIFIADKLAFASGAGGRVKVTAHVFFYRGSEQDKTSCIRLKISLLLSIADGVVIRATSDEQVAPDHQR